MAPQKGFKHTLASRIQMGLTRKKRKIKSWNKGLKGAQVAWNKGLTRETDKRVANYSDNLIGHGCSKSTRKKMSRKAKIRCADGSMKLVVKKKLARWKRLGINPMKGRYAPWVSGRNAPAFRFQNKWYKHLKYGKYYFRSRWELAFARWCRHNKIKFKYEPKTFRIRRGRGRLGTYTPDFYLPEQDVYIEIKGWATKRFWKNIVGLHKAYPNERIIIIDKASMERNKIFDFIPKRLRK